MYKTLREAIQDREKDKKELEARIKSRANEVRQSKVMARDLRVVRRENEEITHIQITPPLPSVNQIKGLERNSWEVLMNPPTFFYETTPMRVEKDQESSGQRILVRAQGRTSAGQLVRVQTDSSQSRDLKGKTMKTPRLRILGTTIYTSGSKS